MPAKGPQSQHRPGHKAPVSTSASWRHAQAYVTCRHQNFLANVHRSTCTLRCLNWSVFLLVETYRAAVADCHVAAEGICHVLSWNLRLLASQQKVCHASEGCVQPPDWHEISFYVHCAGKEIHAQNFICLMVDFRVFTGNENNTKMMFISCFLRKLLKTTDRTIGNVYVHGIFFSGGGGRGAINVKHLHTWSFISVS